MRRSRPTALRAGFTLVEVLVVTILIGIALGFAAPNIGRALAQQRLQRAASVIAADMRLAPSLAARQKAAVRIAFDPMGRRYTLVDRATGTVLITRHLSGSESEYQVASMVVTANQVDVFANGIASGPVNVMIRAAGQQRTISMTRAGQVRVSQ